MPKDKAAMMRVGRKARKEELDNLGLTVTKTAHIKPEDEERFIKYVEGRLGGKVPTKSKGT